MYGYVQFNIKQGLCFMKNYHLDGITSGFMVKLFMWFLLDFTIMLQLLQSPSMSYFFTIVVWNSMKKNKITYNDFSFAF